MTAFDSQKARHRAVPVCACGKNGTPEAHGAVFDETGKQVRRPFTCDEVKAIEARVAYFSRPLPFWRRWWAPKLPGGER